MIEHMKLYAGYIKMRSKYIWGRRIALSACLVLLIILTGCGSSGSESGREELIIGFDVHYPPYTYLSEDGNYIGFDLELAKEVCALQGWELKKQPIDWDERDALLGKGTIDCIWSGFTINGREDAYEWSYPYINNQQVAIVKEDSAITKLDELKGKVIGVQKASAGLTIMEELGYVESAEMVVRCDDNRAAFRALGLDLVDVVVMDVSVAQYQSAYYEGNYRILDEPLQVEQFGIGFSLGNEELRDQVNEALLKLKDKGIYQELGEKYGIEEYLCLGDE